MSETAMNQGWKVTGAAAIAAACLVFSAPAIAQDAASVPASAPVQDTAPVLPATDAESDSETPWYEAFTLSMNETAPQILNEQATIDWESDNGRWGFTLGFDDTQDQRFEIEDVSAGAFVNFGDRFRIGGQFRFTSPEDDLFEQPRDSEDRQPEVKFESALRF